MRSSKQLQMARIPRLQFHSQFPFSSSNIWPFIMEDSDLIISQITLRKVSNKNLIQAITDNVEATKRVAIAKAVIEKKGWEGQKHLRKPRPVWS